LPLLRNLSVLQCET